MTLRSVSLLSTSLGQFNFLAQRHQAILQDQVNMTMERSATTLSSVTKSMDVAKSDKVKVNLCTHTYSIGHVERCLFPPQGKACLAFLVTV